MGGLSDGIDRHMPTALRGHCIPHSGAADQDGRVIWPLFHLHLVRQDQHRWFFEELGGGEGVLELGGQFADRG